MKHIIAKFKPSKVCAFAVSLGGSVFSHVLTEIKVDGSVLMNVPMNFPKVMDQMKNGFGGYLDRAMGDKLNKTIIPHGDNSKMIEAFKSSHNIDLVKVISDLN